VIEHLWRFLQGYVVLKIRGASLERFLNRAARAGVGLWDVERLSSGMLVARIPAGSFRTVRALSRAQGWRISIAEKVGLPFWAAALARRKGLALGALLALAALYVASGHVWFVEVQGDEGIPAARVREVAAAAGLRPGVRRDGVVREEIQKALLLEFDELSWASVHVRGTRAVIEARLRSGLDPVPRPGDLVAARDGIVEQVMATRGHPRVKKGDTVRRGDVLISGFIPPGEPLHRELLDAGQPPYVRAEGIVTARVWYEGTASVPLLQRREAPTGARAWGIEIELGRARVRLGGPPRSYQAHRQARRSWRGTLGSWTAGVHWITYEEVELELVELPAALAEEQARAAAAAQLEAEMPPGVSPVEGPYETVEITLEDGTPAVVVTVRAEAIADIATFREIQF